MKEIPAGDDGLVALVDDEDYPLLSRLTWATVVVPGHPTYAAMSYALRSGKRRDAIKILMHRLVVVCHPGFVLDHRDRNGLNNQKSNLRQCTLSQNLMNSRMQLRSKTSQYKGVHYASTKRCWVAKVKVDGKNVLYRRYQDEIEAALGYDAMARKAFGEFARLNFPAEGEASAIV